MNLSAKTREEIVHAVRGKTRDDLIDIIFSLVVVEQHFTAAEIASRSART